jgi:hypothetical protein
MTRGFKLLLAALVVTIIFLIIAISYAFEGASVTKHVDAENTFTEAIAPAGGVIDRKDPACGYLNVSIYAYGTAFTTGKIVLQRSFDGGTTWYDKTQYTAVSQTSITDYEKNVLYRLGCKTGDMGFAHWDVRLSH